MKAIKLLKNKKVKTIITNQFYACDFLKDIATDYTNYSVIVPIETGDYNEYSASIDGVKLYNALTTMPDAKIRLDSGSVNLSNGPRKVDIKYNSKSETREHENDTSDTKKATFNAVELAENLKKLCKTSAKSDVRYFLNSVFFDTEKLAIVSTNGYCRTVFKHIYALKELEKSLIISNEVIDQVIELINELKPETVELSSKFNDIFFRGVDSVDNTIFKLEAKSIAGRYPDWQRVYSVGDNFYSFDAKKLASEVTFVSKNDTSNTKHLGLVIEKNSATIKLPSDNTDACESVIPCNTIAQSVAIGLNAKYLLQAISNARKDEQVHLNITSSSQAVVLRYVDQDNDNIEFVLMPERVSL